MKNMISILMGSQSDLETKWLKKVYIGIISIVLLGVCCAISAYLFAQEENIKNSNEDNAAIYYSKAFDLLKYPFPAEPDFNKLKEIIERGWQEESKEAEKILEENEPCLSELKKGLLLKKCDFAFGEEYKYLTVKKLPNLVKARNSLNLLLLKGRYYEKQKDFAKAIDCCLSSLAFLHHISQGNSMITDMLVLSLEKNTYLPLKDYLSSQEIDKELCRKILSYLEVFEKQHFSARRIMETEKEYFISDIQMIIDGSLKDQDDLKLNEDMKHKREDLVSQILKQANELADRYYGNFIKAAQTGNKEDLSFALEEAENIKRDAQFQGTDEEIFDAVGMLQDAVTGKIEQFNEKVAHKIVIKMLATRPLSSFKKVLDEYNSSLNELKELKLLAKIKSK